MPGPYVVSTSVIGGTVDSPSGFNTLKLNGTVSSIDVTFDRDMNAASFTAASVLRIQGPAGLISGPFTVTQLSSLWVFRVSFPMQQLSGTYTVTLASSIKSASGYALDTNHNAGIDVRLRGTSSTAPVPVNFTSSDGPVTLTPGRTSTSEITLTDDFLIQGLTLQLDITYPHDPDLSAVLVAPDGTVIPLFSGVGVDRDDPELQQHDLRRQRDDPDHRRRPAFFGRFRPQGGTLSVLNGSSSVKGIDGTGAGVYKLEITNNRPRPPGTLNGWSLTFQKPTADHRPGRAGRRHGAAQLPHLHDGPDQPASSKTWTSVGPASIGGSNSGHDQRDRRRPVRPLGQHGLRRRRHRRRLEDERLPDHQPRGPDLHPAHRLRPDLRHQHRQYRRLRPQQRPQPVDRHRRHRRRRQRGSAGVGFLISEDGGATWTLMDSTNNDAWHSLPSQQPRPRVRRPTAFKVVVDPQPTPTGDVIIYAALSGNNGGIWRSTDTGARASQPGHRQARANLPGQATDLVLDPDSGPADAVTTRPATSRSSTPRSAGRASSSAPTRARSGTYERRRRQPADPGPIAQRPSRSPSTNAGGQPQRRQRPDRPGQARARAQLRPATPRREPHLRGLALRRGRHPRQRTSRGST